MYVLYKYSLSSNALEIGNILKIENNLFYLQKAFHKVHWIQIKHSFLFEVL